MKMIIYQPNGQAVYDDIFPYLPIKKKYKNKRWETMFLFENIYLPAKKGLYAIYFIGAGKPILLYIGKSNNIRKRFRGGSGHHIMNKILRIVESESNLMIKVKLTENITQLEKQYIRRLLPKFNSVLYGVKK